MGRIADERSRLKFKESSGGEESNKSEREIHFKQRHLLISARIR